MKVKYFFFSHDALVTFRRRNYLNFKMTATSNKTFASGILISGIAVGIMGLVNYFSRRSLAFGLTPEDFAFFYGGFAFVAFFGGCLDFGLGSTLNILVPRYQIRRNPSVIRAFASVTLGWRLFWTVVVTGILMSLTPWLTEHFFHYPQGKAVLAWTLALLPLYTTFTFIVDLCSALQEFKLRSVLYVAQTALTLFGIVILLPEYGTLAPPIAFLAAYGISILIGAFWLKWKHSYLRFRPALSSPLLRRLWRLSRWFFLVSLGMAFMGNLDVLFLAKFSTLQDLAFYNIALPVMNVFQVLLVVPMVAMPVCSKLWQEGRKEELANLYAGIQALLLLICGASVVFAAAAGEGLIGLLFKPEYKGAAPALVLLIAGLFFNCMAQVNINLLATTRKPGKIAGAVIAGAIICLIAAFIGAVYFDSRGVAFARSLAMAVMFGFAQYHLSAESGLRFKWKYCLLTVVVTVALCVLCHFGCPGKTTILRSGLLLFLYIILVSPLLRPALNLMRGVSKFHEWNWFKLEK